MRISDWSSDVCSSDLAVHEEALQSQSAAQAAATRFAETVPASAKGPEVFDFDAMVRERAEAEKAPLSQSPRFIAFASLSMPPEALKALVRAMGRAGGVTVLPGFPRSEGRPEGKGGVLKGGYRGGSDY